MKKRNHIKFALLIAGLTFGLMACQTYQVKQIYKETNALIHDVEKLASKPFLKAHLKNGDVFIYKDTWEIDSLNHLVKGEGEHFNFNRYMVKSGVLSVNIDSVSLFETNQKITKPYSNQITAITILTAANIALNIYCISVPKACFGSCPTFYLNEDDNFHYADAEGFSNAILPSMAYSDIDALNVDHYNEKDFAITMKNEALETHCVKAVNLLAVPRNDGEQVYHTTENKFVVCKNQYNLKKAVGAEGNITNTLKNRDRLERYSNADEDNLKSREQIYLTFDGVKDHKNLGLNLSFRQTLMTTFFIYNAMGYMGDEVGDIFSKLERDGNCNEMLEKGLKKSLGDIDIYVWNEMNLKWELQGGFNETGPIAHNHQIIPLTTHTNSNEVKVKIVLNKGLWRIDQIGLTNIQKTVKPIALKPTTIHTEGAVNNEALMQLNDTTKHLISMPGDVFKLNYQLPETKAEYAFFLETEGYYIEWMRSYWLQEKNMLKLRQMLKNPDAYLKQEAKAYSKYEETMEQDFWNSKINTKILSYNENNK